MKIIPILLMLLVPAVQAQPAIWRCESNGRVVYQQEACGGRLVGAKDRRTEAQKRAEREATKREREREKAAEQAQAASAPASDAATPPVPPKPAPKSRP